MVVRLHHHIILMLLLLLAIAACQRKTGERTLDEAYTLSPESKAAFGTSAVRQLMNGVFAGIPTETNKRPFDSWHNSMVNDDNLSDNHLYLLVTPVLNIRKAELEAMKAFVRSGNHLVIVTDGWSDLFTEELQISINDYGSTTMVFNQSRYTDTWVSLKDTSAFAGKQYGFYHEPLSQSLEADSQISDLHTLGLNTRKQPDYVQLKLGRGHIYIHTNARVFSNYFVLSNHNFQYLLAAASYWPAYPQSITWDDFYYRNIFRRPEGRSAFAALLGIPALRWALLILLTLCIIWILSNLRRKQKMIPVMVPNKNASVEFTETVARLYFNERDNQNIARKMGAHFHEFLQRHYYLPPTIRHEDWPGIVAGKTALSETEASRLQAYLHNAGNDLSFTDEDLLHMHWLVHKAMNTKTAQAS